MNSQTQRQVQLSPFQTDWANQFTQEAKQIRSLLGGLCLNIEHIGSTAIPSIYAKPIIDILVSVTQIDAIDQYNDHFMALGYTPRGEYGIKNRRFFNKGEPQRSHHLHIFQDGNREINRHLAFRDTLRAQPNTAQAYSIIKRCLAEQFSYDINHYVNGKESFIRMIDYQSQHAQDDQLAADDKIEIVEYQSHWPKLALAEINAIQQHVALPHAHIQHLGSTAIAGLAAKPTIDIFIAIDDIQSAKEWIQPLHEMGYMFWAENPNQHHLRFFKGMPPYGIRRTHHLHILENNSQFADRVAFCETLKKDADSRTTYAKLKQSLADQHSNDREAYTEAKKDFIKKILQQRQ